MPWICEVFPQPFPARYIRIRLLPQLALQVESTLVRHSTFSSSQAIDGAQNFALRCTSSSE